MSLGFGNATGNLFNVIGKCGLLIKQMAAYQQLQKTNMIDPSAGLIAQLTANPDIAAIVGSSYLSQLSPPETICGIGQQVAQAITNRLVWLDNPLPGQTFTNQPTAASMREVIRQMKQQGATVLAMTIGSSVQPFTGRGQGVIVVSTKRPGDGLVQENSFAETITFTCTKDSYIGNQLAGNELFQASGAGAESDLFAYDWPVGSNASLTLNAVNAGANNSQGNLLTNSSFSTFTVANTPNNFAVVVGTPGTNIFQETTLTYTGTGALRLLGDGSTNIQLTQRFGNSTGTGGTLGSFGQYAFAIWMRSGAVSPGAGKLTVSLVDQNGTLLADANAVNNTFDLSLTGLNTVYAPFTGVFRTPEILPSQIYLKLEITTPITNGVSVYLDTMSLALMRELYQSGPYVSLHSGAPNFIQGDYATAAITNSRGAGGTLNTFQTAWYRLMSPFVASGELMLPSSSIPSISDSLI